jgi:hypothetical protein
MTVPSLRKDNINMIPELDNSVLDRVFLPALTGGKSFFGKIPRNMFFLALLWKKLSRIVA